MALFSANSKSERRAKRKKRLYKRDVIFTEYLNNSLTYYSLFAVVLIQISLLHFSPSTPDLDAWGHIKLLIPILTPIAGLLFFLVSKFFLYLAIKEEIANTGANLKVPENAFLRKGSDKRLRLYPDSRRRYTWVQDEDAEKVIQLHREAYEGTAYGDSISLIHENIKSLISLQSNCILAIPHPDNNGEFIGYTHAFPVTFYTWYKYKNAEIGDADFGSRYVAKRSDQQVENKPFAIVIVSLVLPQKNWKTALENEEKLEIGDHLTGALAFHLKEICQSQFAGVSTVPVIFQTMNNHILKFIKPYKTNNTEFAKDAGQIVCFELQTL